MQKLNLPLYDFRFKSTEKNRFIFDSIRKKYLVLTPEEWVRQNFIRFLNVEKNYPVSLISVERQFRLHNLNKRSDILIFNKEGSPNILVECKEPNVKIEQRDFDQIARYNSVLKATYLIVTNGLQHYFFQINPKEENYLFLDDIPNYGQITT